MAKLNTAQDVPNRRGYWQEQIVTATKRWERFYTAGKLTTERYRLERVETQIDQYKDRYNILYSSTETTRPSLYAQTPRVEATMRHKDRQNDTAVAATLLIEQVTQYALEDVDFDEIMHNVVEDYLLPGMGSAWVRYEPQIESDYGDDKKPIDGTERVVFEGLAVDYIHWRDILFGSCRTWASLPWGAKRVWMNKSKATARFGAVKANDLKYTQKPSERDNARGTDEGGGNQAVIWEIWDKENKKVIWFSDDYALDVLDEKPDPLKLSEFYPFPRPIRAVSTTGTFIPKSFYSQYKAQAEELDLLTERIRFLTEALRLIGVYDGSQEKLQQLLSGKGNKMIPIDNWSQFAGTGGLNSSLQWVPVKEVAEVLMNLLQQRDVVKTEIYEITGFSDIVRGVSKASETLGAQQIKDKWSGGRLRDLQKEVQRFCRDIIRIMSEIICENFSEESLALYSGFEPPPITPEEQQASAQYIAATQQGQQPPMPGQPPMPPPAPPPPTGQAQAIQEFKKVVQLLKDERKRCALIGIETDSTIQPDEAEEREARMQFLSSIGAFLQQAGPMALQFPDMRGLLGAIMMFTVRTFRSSRSIEKEFEEFVKKLAAAPPTPPKGEGSGANPAVEAAKAQASMAETQVKIQADQSTAHIADATKRFEIQQRTATEQQRIAMDHEFRMAEIRIKERELAIQERELGITAVQAAHSASLEAAQQGHEQQMDLTDADREDRALDQQQDQHDATLEAQQQQSQAGENEA